VRLVFANSPRARAAADRWHGDNKREGIGRPQRPASRAEPDALQLTEPGLPQPPSQAMRVLAPPEIAAIRGGGGGWGAFRNRSGNEVLLARLADDKANDDDNRQPWRPAVCGGPMLSGVRH
jgi:hypothetical protein